MKPVRSFIVRFPVTSDAGGDGCSCNGGGGEEVEEEEQVVVVVVGGAVDCETAAPDRRELVLKALG